MVKSSASCVAANPTKRPEANDDSMRLRDAVNRRIRKSSDARSARCRHRANQKPAKPSAPAPPTVSDEPAAAIHAAPTINADAMEATNVVTHTMMRPVMLPRENSTGMTR